MYSQLVEKMGFQLEPVAIYFTDDKPDQAMQFQPGKRGCVASMLFAAAQGKTAVFDEDTYGCPGGGVGICFGDTFTKKNFPAECLLSTGDAAAAERGLSLPVSFGIGERFFASPELVEKWRANIPYTETGKQYVVFRPLGDVDDSAKPDIITFFANPDQLSALVILSGFFRGQACNAIAPFGAACQSILTAYQEIGKEHPQAVIGLFDISQRHKVAKELLSYTVPYAMFLEIEEAVAEGCLVTESWQRIAHRF